MLSTNEGLLRRRKVGLTLSGHKLRPYNRSRRPCRGFPKKQPPRIPVKAVFPRIQRLPPYVFNIVGELKKTARARGEDIIDFGMGNPDQPTPKHIVDKLVEAAVRGTDSDYVKPEHHDEEGVHTHRYSV